MANLWFDFVYGLVVYVVWSEFEKGSLSYEWNISIGAWPLLKPRPAYKSSDQGAFVDIKEQMGKLNETTNCTYSWVYNIYLLYKTTISEICKYIFYVRLIWLIDNEIKRKT